MTHDQRINYKVILKLLAFEILKAKEKYPLLDTDLQEEVNHKNIFGQMLANVLSSVVYSSSASVQLQVFDQVKKLKRIFFPPTIFYLKKVVDITRIKYQTSIYILSQLFLLFRFSLDQRPTIKNLPKSNRAYFIKYTQQKKNKCTVQLIGLVAAGK